MRYNLSIAVCCLLSAVFISCNKENEGKGSFAATTGEASHISCRNAVIAGKATLPSSTASDLKIGILYDTGSGVLYGNAKAVEAKTFDASYNFSITTDVLEPETTYYYRTYIYQNNEVTYGETKSFTTSTISSMLQTLEPADVDASVATLKASLNLADCVYSNLEYGFKLAPIGGEVMTIKASVINNNAYSVKVTDLQRTKQYEVIAYAILDGKTYTADKKTFSTQSVQASVAINEVSGISEHKATISGKVNVSSEGSYSMNARLYYKDSYQSIEDLTQNGSSKNLSLGNDGSFSQEISNLKSATKYFAIVIANVDGIDVSSEVFNFETTDYSASFSSIGWDTTEHTGSISANVSVDSKEQMDITVWALYSDTATDAAGLKTNGTKASASLVANDEYKASLTGLSAGTTYNFIVIAKVGEKEIECQVQQMNTQPIKVSAYLRANATVNECSLALNGTVVSCMQEPLSNFTQAYKVFYSSSETTAEAIVKAGNSKDVSLDQNNEFTITLDNLSSNQTYNCLVESTIDGIQVLGDIQAYTTAKVDASVTTSDAANVRYTSASLSGTFSVNSSTTLSTEAYFLYSETATSLEDLKTQGNKAAATISGSSFTVDLNNIPDGKTNYFVACVKVHDVVVFGSVKSFTTTALPDGAVDLGLSVLWHKHNMGASSEEEYGDYYAWGETETKDVYTIKNYKWRDFNSAYQLTKYNTKWQEGVVDNKTVLEEQDDAAHVVLGNGWHMPSLQNWKELVDNCTWTWTTINGKKGRLITSNINGKSIFLPAAGHKGENGLDYQNNWGTYNSTSLDTVYPEQSRGLHIAERDIDIDADSGISRHIGVPIRPVHD